MNRSTQLRLFVAASAFALSTGAVAQSFPTHQIRLIVPYAAGGITDQVARQLAERVGASLGQTVVVENKPGANGTMGAMLLKGAAADGYTLSMAPVGTFRQPHMQKVSYDPLKDFTYLSMVAGYSSAIGVNSSSPYKNLQDLITAAKTKGSHLTYGTSGTYSTHHLAMVMLGKETGAEWTHVPFKGDSEAISSMMGNNTDFTVVANTMRPFMDEGRLRILATFGDTRSADYPDAPTAKEQGFPVVMASPFGIIGPAGIPAPVVAKLDAAFKNALEEPKFQAFAKQVGLNIMYKNNADYTAYAKEAFAYEKVLLDAAGLQLNQ